VWLRIGTSDVCYEQGNESWVFGIWGMYVSAEDLLASQKGLAAWSYDVMELVGYLICYILSISLYIALFPVLQSQRVWQNIVGVPQEIVE